MRKWPLVLLLSLCFVVAYGDEAEDAPASDDHAAISLEDATRIVRQTYGGRVVSAQAATREQDDQGKKTTVQGYRIRVDVQGRIKTVFVDQRGRIHEE